ncbi:hypothetical protein BD770DRAFT_449791 [Pilaira anomala]|nr:hypothetical protein BD770DRAFT_449791 [Pilaira anomala]
MKDKCFLSLELMASTAKISLDRCVNSWAAKKSVSTNYHNAIRRNQDVKGKRVSSRAVGESQQESLPNDISTHSDIDDLPSIGSEDEEEASAPTSSSSVKRNDK